MGSHDFRLRFQGEAHRSALPKFARACGRPHKGTGGLKQRRWRAFLVSVGPPKAGDTEEAHTLLAGVRIGISRSNRRFICEVRI
jgi:hypothetical protein